MRLSIPIFLMLIFVGMFVGQQMYEWDEINGEKRDIQNLTENTFVWNHTPQEYEIINITGDNDWARLRDQRISKIVNKFVDFIGFSIMEISKYFVEFGYNHPEYDFMFFMQLVKWYLIIMLIGILLPALIPLIALTYLFVIGIKKIIITLFKSNTKVKKC